MTQKIPKAKRRENATYYLLAEAKKAVNAKAKETGISRSLIASRWLLAGAKADT